MIKHLWALAALLAVATTCVAQTAPAEPVMARPRLTPRGTSLEPYPRPAVDPVASGGALGPYGQGLAAAAPVGTPYLRSPAFAGPPIIYMPQTVTRVLVPGITPYPNQIMPVAQYGYSSAPFTRTDIYVDLPYGTFYWPQGYAGTTPVEPQVPVYAVAPSTALMTNEASYAVQRYDESVPPVAPAAAVPVVEAAPTPSLAPLMEAPAPVVTPATAAPTPTPAPAATPAPLTEAVQPAMPEALPPLPSTPPSVPETSPALPPGVPALAPLTGLPAQPPQRGTKPVVEPGAIVVDDKTPGALELDPPTGWQPSVNVADSYEGSSIVAAVGVEKRSATFKADIPEAGEYEVSLWWVASSSQFRSSAVPVIINTADGPVKTTVNQTTGANTFNVIGKYKFNAGPNQPILTITTEGIEPGPTLNVSVDAVKLVKVQ
jgi:hypothetical protein